MSIKAIILVLALVAVAAPAALAQDGDALPMPTQAEMSTMLRTALNNAVPISSSSSPRTPQRIKVATGPPTLGESPMVLMTSDRRYFVAVALARISVVNGLGKAAPDRRALAPLSRLPEVKDYPARKGNDPGYFLVISVRPDPRVLEASYQRIMINGRLPVNGGRLRRGVLTVSGPSAIGLVVEEDSAVHQHGTLTRVTTGKGMRFTPVPACR